MTTVLVILSLCLHLVTFYIIVILIQRMNQLKADKPESVKEDLENTMNEFVAAVREENEALVKKLKNIEVSQIFKPKNEQSSDFHIPFQKPQESERTNKIPSRSSVNEIKEDSNSNVRAPETIHDEPPEALPHDDIQDKVEQSFAAQVLHLHASGASHAEIAKKLNKGIGEVELVINLSKKK